MDQISILRSYSHGEVCHIVQLCISQHDLLGYRGGRLVPYTMSKNRERAACCQSMHAGDRCANTFEEAAQSMRILVNESRKPILLSRLKYLFRMRFELELSEMAL